MPDRDLDDLLGGLVDKIAPLTDRVNDLEKIEQSGGGGGGHVIEEDGVPLPAEPDLNFAEGLDASDDAGNTATLVVLGDHDHLGAATGDGGNFDAANLGSGAAADGEILTADGAGRSAWEAQATNIKEVVFTLSGTLYISTGGIRIYNTMGLDFDIEEVEIAVSTAPTGNPITVDIHKNGVTIFTNQAHRPVILAAAFQGTTTDIDVPGWDDGDYLTMDIDGIGTTVAGVNLAVMIRAVKV